MFNCQNGIIPLYYKYAQSCVIIYKEQITGSLISVKSLGMYLQAQGQITLLPEMPLLVQVHQSLAKLKQRETTVLLVRWDAPTGSKNRETQ